MIEALTERGWSKNRISTEEAVDVDTGKGPGGRTDIICYDRSFFPKLLVECKAEHVPISTRVAEQTARYNRSIGAPYLLMSNGIVDYWYQIPDRQEILRLEAPPDFLNTPDKRNERPFSYWSERGFAGENAGKDQRDLLSRMLNHFWFGIGGEMFYLSFSDSPTALDLAHYYKIFGQTGEKTAVGFLNTPSGETRLIAVFNRDGKNAGVLETDLDLLFSGESSQNTTLYTATGNETTDLREHGITGSNLPGIKYLQALPRTLNTLFNTLNR